VLLAQKVAALWEVQAGSGCGAEAQRGGAAQGAPQGAAQDHTDNCTTAVCFFRGQHLSMCTKTDWAAANKLSREKVTAVITTDSLAFANTHQRPGMRSA
jgi:hypothetical protein